MDELNATSSSFERVAIVCSVDDLRTDGHVMRRDLPSSERMQRAARTFGICFLIACATLFIPVLHFILPPLFLIVGGVFATTTWLETSEIGSGEITCPNCKKVMQLRRIAEEWPMSQRCEGCSYTLSLNRTSEKSTTDLSH